MTDYADWFRRISGGRGEPHSWQLELADQATCANRLIRIPTGFGKTLGVVGAWLYHRVALREVGWPTRLIWCLPMRTLVEQTVAEAEASCRNAGVLWDCASSREGRVAVHTLMGGVAGGEWHLWPEEPAILVGTQDMLLSRALNRGYASPRARWPMEFGLLNQDALWIMDEVQLMDVGLATSAQLQAFRELHQENRSHLRACKTWWMSATLQRHWLSSRDTDGWLPDVPQHSIPAEHRTGTLWSVTKSCRLDPTLKDPKQLAGEVAKAHVEHGAGTEGPTLVVVNTVDRAVAVAQQLRKRGLKGTDIRLVHSRYRPRERRSWRDEFLCRDACKPGTDRIVVATQVVEAGVDFSASLLFTDLAPWPSLVQRFGRAARWGGHGRVVVVDTEPKDDAAAAPYGKDDLDASREAIQQLSDVSPLALETFESVCGQAMLDQLYPYDPAHLLLEHEVSELFDTSPDLSGADIDVSRFIRSGDERDVSVFWAPIPPRGAPLPDLQPSRDALCAVPFLRARDWLCGKETQSKRAPRLRQRRSAWVWNWVDGTWREAQRVDLYPGQTVLVDAAFGGYNWDSRSGIGVGWNPDHRETVEVVAPDSSPVADRADAAQDDESLSHHLYKTIETHSNEVAGVARDIADRLVPSLSQLVGLAARWHDIGKAHPAFQGSIRADGRPARPDLAKAPPSAWDRASLYRMDSGERRMGFRHELASTLVLFAILRDCKPSHAALLGPWEGLMAALGKAERPKGVEPRRPTESEGEILALDAAGFDLVAYLVCAHHGKVRLSWNAGPSDQRALESTGELTIRGVRTGDVLGIVDRGASWLLDLSPASIGLSTRTGMSWTDRVLGLLREHGPFGLAWLEAILRAADQRASRLSTVDPLLVSEPSR